MLTCCCEVEEEEGAEGAVDCVVVTETIMKVVGH